MSLAVTEPAARTGVQTWKDDGLCAGRMEDAESWFPAPSKPDWETEAECYQDGDKDRPCPVMARCLQYAIDHDERDGTWGGVSETRRAVLTGRRPPARRGLILHCPICARETVSYWMKRKDPARWHGYPRRGRDGICEPCMQNMRRHRARQEAS